MEGLSRLFELLPEDVALLMHCFTKLIGFGGFEIDRLVTDYALDFQTRGMSHRGHPLWMS
jgi:hypothetical protein